MSEIFCSWSGGKDSCLALYLAQQQGVKVSTLFTMMVPEIGRSRSHGIRQDILEEQAQLMDMTWLCRSATWDAYRTQFLNGLASLADQGMIGGVFGDIDADAHKQWNIDVCAEYGMQAIHPIWQRDRQQLLDLFLSLGFQARIICVREGVLDPSFVGRELNQDTLRDLRGEDIDFCGENGEYHTLVVDGPLFSQRLDVAFGDPQLRGGMWVADVKRTTQCRNSAMGE